MTNPLGIIVRHLLKYYDFAPDVVKVPIRWSTRGAFWLIHKCQAFSKTTRIPLVIRHIRVQDVKFVSNRTLKNESLFVKHFYHGCVLSGDWDLERIPTEDYELFQFSEDIFVKGLRWEETTYYQRIRDGQAERHIRGERHLRYRIRQYVNLYERIKTEGFQSQQDLNNGSHYDEVCLSIDRNGTYVLEDGRHRFFIAKVLGIEQIPVTINRVHQRFWSSNKSL